MKTAVLYGQESVFVRLLHGIFRRLGTRRRALHGCAREQIPVVSFAILGGRTNHYGRFSFRFADYDFKPYSRDGLGTDWPITYDEISPYYDKAEAFIGVTGTKEGIPSAPDGIFQPPPPPRVHEVLVQRACKKLDIPCIPNRMAVITTPLNGRPPCHYCGQCGRGCVTASNYSSSQVQILPALKSGAREGISERDGSGTYHRCIGQSYGGFLHRQRDTRRAADHGAARWWWPVARAKRRDCC